MSSKPRSCFKETSRYRNGDALAVTDTSGVPTILHSSSTLNLNRSLAIQKVLSPEDVEMNHFFHSGGIGTSKDTPGALFLLDKAMPTILDGTANCAIIFDKDLKVISGRFEENLHFSRPVFRGKGASGEVTAHTDEQSKKNFVRKKILKGKALRREEVEAMLLLRHQSICEIYGLLCADGIVDMLMQDAGHSLRQCLQIFIQKGIGDERYWRVVRDLSCQGFEALRYIHGRNFYHLDIKPENILVRLSEQKQPVLVLADFGTCLQATQKMTFKLQLTPEYWAPELWQKVKPFLSSFEAYNYLLQNSFSFAPQASFDVFAMGLTVYFMCTLKHLIKELEENMKDIVTPEEIHQFCQAIKIKHSAFASKFILMTEHPELIPQKAMEGNWVCRDIPLVLSELIAKTLNPDPEERFTDDDAIRLITENPVPMMNTPVPASDAFKSPTQVTASHEPVIIYEEPASLDERVIHPDNFENAVDVCTSMAVLSLDEQLSKFISPWDFDVRSNMHPVPQFACPQIPETPVFHVSKTPFIPQVSKAPVVPQVSTAQVPQTLILPTTCVSYQDHLPQADQGQSFNLNPDQIEISKVHHVQQQNIRLYNNLGLLEHDIYSQATGGGKTVDLSSHVISFQPLEHEPQTTLNNLFWQDEKKMDFDPYSDKLLDSVIATGYTKKASGLHMESKTVVSMIQSPWDVSANNTGTSFHTPRIQADHAQLWQGKPNHFESPPKIPPEKGLGGVHPLKPWGSKGKRALPYDVNARSSDTNPSNSAYQKQGKLPVPDKKMPALELAALNQQMQPFNGKVPFLVASSSRPALTTRHIYGGKSSPVPDALSCSESSTRMIEQNPCSPPFVGGGNGARDAGLVNPATYVPLHRTATEPVYEPMSPMQVVESPQGIGNLPNFHLFD